jgi:Ca2+-dependent lipid-binding protein
MDEDKSERGKILVSLFYSKSTSNFHVKIIRGIQLLPMDFGHTSDPYCKLSLYPSSDMSHKWSFKTAVKKHTLKPEFNEEFVFQHIQLQELISKTLQITVYDKDIGKKDDYIGKYFI